MILKRALVIIEYRCTDNEDVQRQLYQLGPKHGRSAGH